MLKRLFDIAVATSALLVLSPLLLLLTLLVKLDSAGPALFKQIRVGQRGKLFRIFKFRTMQHTLRPEGPLLTAGSDPRITRLGETLRRWKLDELPQLINVLKGEMSLVGPRPEVPRYVARYDEVQRRVLEVRPGITDPASIEFRDENKLLGGQSDHESFYLEQVMPRKLELNLRYIEHQSLLLDLRIILLTVARVLQPSDARRGFAGDTQRQTVTPGGR